MKISSIKRGKVCVVTVRDKKIDASVAVEFKNILLDLVRGGETKIALNMKEVDFIDSSGLGALVSIYKSLGQGGQIKLFAVGDRVRSIFELTSLDQVFDIHVSEKGALEGMT